MRREKLTREEERERRGTAKGIEEFKSREKKQKVEEKRGCLNQAV